MFFLTEMIRRGKRFFGPPSAPFLSALQLQCCVVRETSKSNIPQGRLVMDTGGEEGEERERPLPRFLRLLLRKRSRKKWMHRHTNNKKKTHFSHTQATKERK